MSDTSDFKRLDLEDQTAEDEGSFATWLPPMLSAEPSPLRPPATLTGLGPPSGPRASVSIESPESGDFGLEPVRAKESLPVAPPDEEPLYMEPADADEDDEPTRVITQLFPSLTSKVRALSSSGAPLNGAAPAASEPQRESSSIANEASGPVSDVRPGKSESSPEATQSADALADAVPESGSSDSITAAGLTKVAILAEALEEPRATAPAETQEAQLASLMIETLSKRRSSRPMRYRAAPPTVHEAEQAPAASSVELTDSGTPSLGPPEVPTSAQAASSGGAVPVYPPTIEVAQHIERELPTSPASRRLTPPAELARPPQTTLARSEPPWAATVRPKASFPSPRVALRYAIFAFAASALATVLLLRALLPGKGTVLVTAVGVSGMPVDNAQVLVDGSFACAPVPCRVNKLKEGRHFVTVKASGYQPIADRAISIDSNNEALVHFALNPENTAGIHVRVEARGLHVFLDGEDRGEAPLTLAGLAPTEHTIRLSGSPLYAAFEQKIALRPNSTLTFSPSLVALQAFIALSPGSGAKSAAVEVLGGSERKAVFELPARIEVRPLGTYRIHATRAGYHDFETEVRFGEGEAEKQLRIELVPASAPVPPKPGSNTVPVVLEETPTAAAKPSPLAAAMANGSLDVNSTPVSNVIVDGRPIGSTPRQLALAPGNHSVVFVHPTRGRKTMSVKVEPGRTAVAAARF